MADLHVGEDRRHVGDLVMNPVALGALIVLVVNDHWGKDKFANWITGKLSDFAGMILFPLLAVSVVEAARWCIRRKRWPLDPRAMTIACVATGVAFALSKTWGPMGDLYREAYSTAQWPLRAARAAVIGEAIPGRPAIGLVTDRTDLLALAALAVPWWYGRRILRRPIR